MCPYYIITDKMYHHSLDDDEYHEVRLGLKSSPPNANLSTVENLLTFAVSPFITIMNTLITVLP